MLVLTRRVGESVLVGSDIEIKVVKVQGDCVRLAIKAPKGIGIFRREIIDAVKAQNKQAADMSAEDASCLIKLLK